MRSEERGERREERGERREELNAGVLRCRILIGIVELLHDVLCCVAQQGTTQRNAWPCVPCARSS